MEPTKQGPPSQIHQKTHPHRHPCSDFHACNTNAPALATKSTVPYNVYDPTRAQAINRRNTAEIDQAFTRLGRPFPGKDSWLLVFCNLSLSGQENVETWVSPCPKDNGGLRYLSESCGVWESDTFPTRRTHLVSEIDAFQTMCNLIAVSANDDRHYTTTSNMYIR